MKFSKLTWVVLASLAAFLWSCNDESIMPVQQSAGTAAVSGEKSDGYAAERNLNPFPGPVEWLDEQEVHGGHTLARHWGKSVEWLQERACTDKKNLVSAFGSTHGGGNLRELATLLQQEFMGKLSEYTDLPNNKTLAWDVQIPSRANLGAASVKVQNGKTRVDACRNRHDDNYWDMQYDATELKMVVKKKNGKVFLLTAYPIKFKITVDKLKRKKKS